jgi:hypothetical protein
MHKKYTADEILKICLLIQQQGIDVDELSRATGTRFNAIACQIDFNLITVATNRSEDGIVRMIKELGFARYDMLFSKKWLNAVTETR